MATPTVKWAGYEFNVHPMQGTSWNNVAGVYIFTGLNQRNRWVAYYIGQTASLANRLPGHERADEAVLAGATHIHARVVKQASQRAELEEELIEAYSPPLNE